MALTILIKFSYWYQLFGWLTICKKPHLHLKVFSHAKIYASPVALWQLYLYDTGTVPSVTIEVQRPEPMSKFQHEMGHINQISQRK